MIITCEIYAVGGGEFFDVVQRFSCFSSPSRSFFFLDSISSLAKKRACELKLSDLGFLFVAPHTRKGCSVLFFGVRAGFSIWSLFADVISRIIDFLALFFQIDPWKILNFRNKPKFSRINRKILWNVSKIVLNV